MKIELGQTTTQYNGSINVKIAFDKAMLHLTDTPFGIIIDIDECISTGDPGGPRLPSKIIRIALPPLTVPTTVLGEQLKTILLSQNPVLIAPIQSPRPGVNRDVLHSDGEHGRQQRPKESFKPSTIRSVREEPFVEPFPVPPIVLPKEELYNLAVERPIVRLITLYFSFAKHLFCPNFNSRYWIGYLI